MRQAVTTYQLRTALKFWVKLCHSGVKFWVKLRHSGVKLTRRYVLDVGEGLLGPASKRTGRNDLASLDQLIAEISDRFLQAMSHRNLRMSSGNYIRTKTKREGKCEFFKCDEEGGQ